MYRKDQIKGIIAIILFSIIGICYLFFSDEVAKSAALVGIILWLAAMYYLNKREGEDQE